MADTYNNKIKVVDPRQATSLTIAGTGKQGADDDPATFDEPAGLAYANGKLYVAGLDLSRGAVTDERLHAGRAGIEWEFTGRVLPLDADQARNALEIEDALRQAGEGFV